MSTTVFITIDTEEDLWGEYRTGNNPVLNVLRVPLVQELFDRYGAKPTYLINWPVASDEAASKTLRRIADAGNCEIGTHCHPWNTPPFEEVVGRYNSMLCNLPPALIEKKLDNLHALISERMNVAPVSFRAGRWAFNEAVARCLARLDYAVDTSVSPTMNWSGDDGADFTGAMTRPYRFDPDDIRTEKPNGQLLEVPPTIGFWQGNHDSQMRLQARLSGPLSGLFRVRGILDRLNLLNHRWLSPEQSTGDDMIRLARHRVSEGAQVLNMCFHSNSLLPGVTPFVRGSAEFEQFMERIRTFLEFATRSGYSFAPLSHAATGVFT